MFTLRIYTKANLIMDQLLLNVTNPAFLIIYITVAIK